MSVGACIQNVESALRPYLQSGALPGYVAAVSIAGERGVHAAGMTATHLGAHAMSPDTLFRIASLSKIVAGVLALSLERDGVIALDATVDRWLPELATPRVIRDVRGPLEDTVPADRPIRVGDLLTLTAGMGRFLPEGPLHAAMIEQGFEAGAFPPMFSHDEFITRLAALPLAHQPGAGWLYHTGIDVLSVLMARAAGASLSGLVADRIAGPLGLASLDFQAASPDRLATSYEPAPGGGALELSDPPSGPFSRPPRFESLGSGLVCSAPDFLAFMEPLALGGGSVLPAESVRRLGADQLDARQRAAAQRFFGARWSWGLGCQVKLSAGDTALAPGGFGWNGGKGTTAYVDPSRELAGVLFTQRGLTGPRPTQFFVDFWAAVYRGL
jgi:CubicO group peptidase (beta-lactamase class C family)